MPFDKKEFLDHLENILENSYRTMSNANHDGDFRLFNKTLELQTELREKIAETKQALEKENFVDVK